jgi:hypothetical protein
MLLACAALCVPSFASAQTPTAGERLEEFVRLTQFASTYSAGVKFPAQWCYSAKFDRTYNAWYLTNALTGDLKASRVQNTFAIPFILDKYGILTKGAIVVGYAIDGGTPTGSLSPSPVAAWSRDCPIGTELLTRAPYRVARLATDLSMQTLIDPAPEYQYWYVYGRPRRVRLILAIPASFQIGANEVAGRILLAFTSDG